MKFRGKKIQILIVVLALFSSSIACSQGYLSSADLTATAVSSQSTAIALSSIIPSGTPVSATRTPTTTSTNPSAIGSGQIIGDAIQTLTSTNSPTETVTATLDPAISPTSLPPTLYYTQSGDTLPAIAVRFDVPTTAVQSTGGIPETGLLTPGNLLVIFTNLTNTGPSQIALPDSEIVYSPSALDFDVETFVTAAGGYLSRYREYLSTGWLNGAQVVERVAVENSVNPRLLLSLIEYRSGWVTGTPTTIAETDYPLGFYNNSYQGLYQQLSWAVSQLSIGFYGWRAGLLTEVTVGEETIRLAPSLNAGTVALQYLFAQFEEDSRRWAGDLYGADSLPVLFEDMFGNPFLRAQTVEPLYPPSLTQPPMELPFNNGDTWSFTGGPHSAWGPDGALAAIDFAPRSMESGCTQSDNWVTAVAAGLVVRSAYGVVVLDLDGDGSEQTGWDVMYLHIATRDRVPVGTFVDVNDHIGHPSCEGGLATGTHTHIARKYNGEWILADGPMPFTLSGWVAHAGAEPYDGTLTNGNQTVTANPNGTWDTLISRPANE